MTQDPSKNDIIFDVILSAAESRDLMRENVSDIEKNGIAINERLFGDLLNHVRDAQEDLNSVVSFESKCQALKDEASFIERLVEIPTKLDLYINCPRHFDDALLLLERVAELNKLYGQDLPIIARISDLTQHCPHHLTTNLCNQLDEIREGNKEDLKRIINQLTRCCCLPERELRIRFLEARDNWFNEECEARAESFDELVTFFCRGLPQVFEEYKNIFGDSSALANSKLIAMSKSDTAGNEDGTIINSWLLLKATTFIISVESHLNTLAHTSLTPKALGEFMKVSFKLTDYLASIGFDFSSQLKPIIVKCVISEIKFNIDRNTTKFEVEFTNTISKSIESLLLPIEDEILTSSSLEIQLPKSIEHYPVFKIYCLRLVESMKWIEATRNFLSPVCLCQDVYMALNTSLTRVMNGLAVVLNMDNNSSHPILSKIAISFLTEVLPFITSYCELYFPEKVVLSALGLSKTEFKSICNNEPDKVRDFRLDMRRIGHPLRGIMPSLMQTIEG